MKEYLCWRRFYKLIILILQIEFYDPAQRNLGSDWWHFQKEIWRSRDNIKQSLHSWLVKTHLLITPTKSTPPTYPAPAMNLYFKEGNATAEAELSTLGMADGSVTLGQLAPDAFSENWTGS